eukprot:6506857-Alexandrium_andersonii.AAC.1
MFVELAAPEKDGVVAELGREPEEHRRRRPRRAPGGSEGATAEVCGEDGLLSLGPRSGPQSEEEDETPRPRPKPGERAMEL